MTASAAATHDRLGGPGSWLLALPPHHIAGIQVLVRSVLAGSAPVELDVSSGFDIDFASPGGVYPPVNEDSVNVRLSKNLFMRSAF